MHFFDFGLFVVVAWHVRDAGRRSMAEAPTIVPLNTVKEYYEAIKGPGLVIVDYFATWCVLPF